MIKINLLPVAAGSRQKTKNPLEFKMPKLGPEAIKISAGILSALIALHFLLGLSILIKGGSLNGLQTKWRKLEPRKKEVESANAQISSAEKTIAPIRELVEKRLFWSSKLNQLSNLMAPGVWLTKLFVQTRALDAKKGEYARSLNIEGCASSLYGNEATLAAKFTKALQDDKEFSRHFSEIKLGAMEKDILDNIPVMDFKLYCYFREKDQP